MKSDPLILLFAATTDDNVIPKVIEELDQLEKILSPACRELGFELKVFYRSQANEVIEFINKNKERLIILHFAGHSNNQYLTLDRGELHADGLQIKLAQCPRLKLVFLNGCDNAGQVEQFSNNEVANVIGTTELIKDNIALQFSQQFYKAFAEQEITIREAYEQASSDIKSNHREEDITRSYDLSGITKKTIPWLLRSKRPEWKLKEEADYCKQLPPLPPPKELPNSPYKGLAHYTKADAHIFFGRCKNILDLLQRLQSPEPVTILHGGTGVGKSSFLFAGLVPRIETYGSEVHSIRFTEIDQNEDILETLFQTKDLAQIEQKMHSQSSFPNVYIFDQVEELFIIENIDKSSNKIPYSLNILLNLLIKVFYDEDETLKPINARVIFSIRTEWYGQISSILDDKYHIRFNQEALMTICENDINEIILSPTKIKKLKNKYKISIENGLDKKITSDIISKNMSSAATVLQIILKKLLEVDENWNFQKYLNIKDQGFDLSIYIDNEIKKIANSYHWGEEAEKNGLLLDVLYSHTTKHETAKRVALNEYLFNYNHIVYAKELLISLQSSHLITISKESESRITHDLIAKVVVNKFNASQLPGQQLRRLLLGKEKPKKNDLLTKNELNIVKKGIYGTINYENKLKITELIKRSRKHLLFQKFNSVTTQLVAVTFIILVILIYSGWDDEAAKNETNKAIIESSIIKTLMQNNNKLLHDEILNKSIPIIDRLDQTQRYPKDLQIENRIILSELSLYIGVIKKIRNNSTESLTYIKSSINHSNYLLKEARNSKEKNRAIFLLIHAYTVMNCDNSDKDIEKEIKKLYNDIDEEYFLRSISKIDYCIFDYFKETLKKDGYYENYM